MNDPEQRQLHDLRTSGSPNLDVKSVDTQLLASSRHILGSQHGSVWGRLVTICLNLHATCNTTDGFAATGITQTSASETVYDKGTPQSPL